MDMYDKTKRKGQKYLMDIIGREQPTGVGRFHWS